ncbi:hypothetical protein GQ473_03010 [archaeon]|nr:hypothetical protein [archaeon]
MTNEFPLKMQIRGRIIEAKPITYSIQFFELPILNITWQTLKKLLTYIVIKGVHK